MSETTKTDLTDLSLSDVWTALTGAGAQVYEWCEQGVSAGVQVIRLGDNLCLTVCDQDGYKLQDWDDVEHAELVPTEEYDEEEAVRAASDLTGYCGVVGLPGSQYHGYKWFKTEEKAAAWATEARDRLLAENPVIGTLQSEVLTGAEAFACEYRDGNKVYFDLKASGQPGYEHSR